MTQLEKIELAVILLAGVGALLAAKVLPNELSAGRIILGASALLLLQSLVRDISLLAKKRGESPPTSARKAQCMCMESTIGAVGVLGGGLLLGLGVDRAVAIPHWGWSVLVVAVLALGFWIKDYLFGWNPWRIEKDKDHMNIVFTWKT